MFRKYPSRQFLLGFFPIACLAFGVLALTHPLSISAQEKDRKTSILGELEKVRQKVEREKGRMRTLEEQKKSIVLELDEIEEMSAVTARERTLLRDALEELKEESSELDAAAGDTKEKIGKLRERIRSRIIAIYKTQRRSSVADYLLRASSATELLKRTYYLGIVARYDRGKIDSLQSEIKNLQDNQNRLAGIRESKKTHLEELDKLGKKLEHQRVKKASLLLEKKEKAEQSEKSLAKLKRSASRLESVLSKIMGGEQPADIPPEAEPEKPENVEVAKLPRRPDLDVRPFRGKGLGHLRGRLQFPVQGETLRRFGKQRHEEFADVLFVKGLELVSPVGSKVRAVADAKVILSKILPGYGNVVILDHGKRYYTLYGRIAGMLCRVGDVVKAGQVIAVVGEPDHKGRNFYFELRIRGKATNPSAYFRKTPPLRKKIT